MKKRKNILMICLSILLIFSLSGCGKNKDENNPLSKVNFDIPNYTLVENIVTTENMQSVEKTIINYNYGYVNANEYAYYGYLGEQSNENKWDNYFQVFYKDGLTYYFHNNGWYKGNYTNDFAMYNDSIKSVFTFDNLKDATKDENTVNIEKTECYSYHKKITNVLSFEPNIQEYSLDFYIDIASNSLYYAEFVNDANGTKTTIIYKPFNEYMTPIVYDLKTDKEEIFDNLSTSEQITGLTEEEIEEKLENNDLNGYYFTDGTYSRNVDFSKSFEMYQNNILMQKYDAETNIMINYAYSTDDDGNKIVEENIIEDYISDENVGNNLVTDFSNIENVYDYSIKDLYNWNKSSFSSNNYTLKSLLGTFITYTDFDKDLTDDQKDFCNTLVNYFNNKTLNQLLTYSISDDYTDTEKCVIYYIANKYSFVIDNGYTMMDLLQLKGFDVEYYGSLVNTYSSYYQNYSDTNFGANDKTNEE